MFNLYTFALLITLTGLSCKPFRFNGKEYNRGELIEIVYKHVLGLIAKKDANTSWRAGDDIPEYKRSVKSKGFTLTDEYLGDTKEEIITTYMASVHSESFAYCIIDIEKGILEVYVMNKAQFATFLKLFASMDKNSKTGKPKLRVKNETNKLIDWLKMNCKG